MVLTPIPVIPDPVLIYHPQILPLSTMHGSFKLCNSMILWNIVLTFLSWESCSFAHGCEANNLQIPTYCEWPQHPFSWASTHEIRAFLTLSSWPQSRLHLQAGSSRCFCHIFAGPSWSLSSRHGGFLRSVEISREHASILITPGLDITAQLQFPVFLSCSC